MSEQQRRILLAAPSSGSGKTLMTCALLRILQRRGLNVTSFKCGPDYIDPMFHQTVLGIPSRNLDIFLAGDQIRDILAAGSPKDSVAVMEGVMGYFDGMGAVSMDGSTYDVARRTGTKTILVIDCKGRSRSIVPEVMGFCSYEPENQIAGVLLNRISPMIYPMIKKQIEEEAGIPILGMMPRLNDLSWDSRHLGLFMPQDIPDILAQIDRAADALEKTLEIEQLLQIAAESDAPKPNTSQTREEDTYDRVVRIGIAKDEAFCFYYQDNLELLERCGAKLIEFSPLHDTQLPEVDGLLIGGGYPELSVKALSENSLMKQQIRQAIEDGMPVLGECGGFMYLQEEMADPKGQVYPMVGAIKGSSHITGKLVRFGYTTLTPVQGDALYLKEGHTIRAHEFHYYDSTNNGETCISKKPTSDRSWYSMVTYKQVMAGYAHLYYRSDPAFVRNYIAACRRYQDGK